jgi:hypothetical protein
MWRGGVVSESSLIKLRGSEGGAEEYEGKGQQGHMRRS